MCSWFDKIINGKSYRIRLATDSGSDRPVVEEMARLNDWYGLSTPLHIGWDSESFFHPDVGVVIDLTDIQAKTASAGLDSADVWTVTTFILGHEQTHAYHLETGLHAADRKRREAHCDYLSGLYVGLLLTMGGIWPDSVRDAAFSIGSADSSEYPTPDERSRCVARGMSTMAWNMSAHFQMKRMGDMDSEFVESLDKHIDTESWSVIDFILAHRG